MPGLLTYWHTIRHLRPIQLYGRVWFRLVRPRIDLRPPPPLRLLNCRKWVRPARRRISLIGPDRFNFLNEIHALNDCGWNDTSIDKLWRYNLHYFDDLNAIDASLRSVWHQALLLQWVRENPPAIGLGWEPYPTSLRIVNWIKWVLGGSILPSECIKSLAVQVRWLCRRLEIHLQGNHLFANAKALVFAGLFFDGSEASYWLEKGLRMLKREVRKQILADGGHFERSTLYHSLVLEDMLDLYNFTTVCKGVIPACWQSTIAGWKERINAMRKWLAAMSHPDGEISFFNDAAMGVAPVPSELEWYAARLGLPHHLPSAQSITHLFDSGYVRIEQGNAVLLLDVAPVGPDYIPGHAHADTLTFEMSLFGQRIFVNSGTSCYGNSIERLRQRGTAAHNTVVVDGQDSSEVWSGFRVARRAHPIGLEFMQNGETIMVRCAHDGYWRIPGKPEHIRRWLFSKNKLVVEDQVSGSFKRAEARFHLHPTVKIVKNCQDFGKAKKVVLQLLQGQKVYFSVEGGSLRKEPATWHPEFGHNEPSFCLVADLNQPFLRTFIEWGNVG